MSHVTHFVAILLGALCLSGGAQARSPVCIIQVSDLHLSEFNSSQYAQFGDRLADFRLISRTVWKAVKPSAVLLTGDLVDGKNRNGGGRQSECEWQDYRIAVDSIKANVGLDEADILDVRGNHDTFSVKARQGQSDYFAHYSAAGRRNASSRVYIRHLGRDAAEEEVCPAAILVGIDVSLEPGLTGMNFFGQGPASLLLEVDQILLEATNELRERGCGGRSIVAYGHYPLEVIGHGETNPWWPWGVVKPQHKGLAPSLRQVLMDHNTSAYLNGHLHSAFGNKLHRMHRNGATGRYMAELETAAWLTCRRFRVLCLDQASMSFSDLYLHSANSPATKSTPGGGREHSVDGAKFSIASEEASQEVGDHIVVITWPPSARYSPLVQPQGAGAHDPTSVRVMLLPILQDLHHKSIEVSFVLQCDGTELVNSMQHDGGQLWLGYLGSAACSGPTALIQVKVSDGSCSELRPVAVVKQGDRLQFAEPQSYVPLDTTWFDWACSIALRIDWPLWGYRIMFAVWGLLFFGFLVLPRLAVSLGWPDRLDAWLESRQALYRIIMSGLLYPAIILMDAASLPEIWNPLAMYFGYLGVGPWAAVRFLEGEPLGIYQLGRVLYFLQGKPHYVHSVDTSIGVVIHMILTLGPLTLVFASTASRVKRMALRPALWNLVTVPHLLCFVLALYPNWILLRKFAYSHLGLLVNVMAWPTPFFAFLLFRLSRISCTRDAGIATATEYKSD